MLDTAFAQQSLPRVPIGDLVAPVATRNPTTTASDDEFTYIDLSAVDQEQKAITGARPVLGADAPSRARQVVRAGDVLVSTVRPNLNGVALVSNKYDGEIASTGFCVLRPIAERLDARFLFHWVRSSDFVGSMVRQASGASYPAVTDAIVRKSAIPCPPLEEQRRIAAILDQADALRAKRRAALAQLDELARAIFVEMFGLPKENLRGWPLRRLPEFCSPKQWPTITSQELLSEGFPVFGANGVIGYFSAYNHADPTVLITCRGATCGTINISLPRSYVTGNAMALDDPNADLVDIHYLAAALKERGLEDAISGSAQPQITRQSLAPVQIPLPPIELQREYRANMVNLENLRGRHDAARRALDDLFTSLQHRAFRGEL